MIAAHVLRGAAWIIAILALIDPVLTAERQAPVDLTIVTTRTASLDLPAVTGGETRRDSLAAATTALEARLGAGYRVRHLEAITGMEADWCAGADACVVAGDDTAAPSGTSVSVPHLGMVVAGVMSPNVAVRDVRTSPTQHADAFGRAVVSLEGHGVDGRRTTVRLLDGTQERGQAIHEWRDGDTNVEVEVQWWPAGEGNRMLTIEAAPLEDEVSRLDNTATAVVRVSRARLPVLVYEPRPSWAAAFVRRALENDPRLQVEARTRVSPRTAVTTRDAAALTPRALEDVTLVVVGGLEALTQAEVALLQEFVTRRGGSLLLLPDRMPEGPATSLFPGQLREQLVGSPVGVGPLQATELALLATPSPVDRVLLALGDGPAVVVESPVGHGRIVVSGAMDAWRHRGADEGFDAFWQGLASRLAADAGASFQLQPPAAIAGVDEAVAFEVRWRSLTEDEGAWPALTAWLTCEGTEQRPLTVWPEAMPGVYRVKVQAGAQGRCAVEVAPISRPELSQVAELTVGEGAPARPAHRGVLTSLVRSRGGAVVEAADVDELAEAVRAAAPAALEPYGARPMRAPWWTLLFAGALGGEWWIRRRHGLR